jgi:FAD:protein FMN transferase
MRYLLKRLSAASLLLMLYPTAQAADLPLLSHTFEGGVMGTEVKIEAYGSDQQLLKNAVTAAVAELRRVEDVMTTWRPSPLTRLNDQAGKGPVKVETELAQIIARGRELHALTDGAFDLSFYSVGRLWKFKGETPRLPDDTAIQGALEQVGADRIKVDEAASTVELPKGMTIGLGGLAKGYGVDRAMLILRKMGIKHAIVNAGGDLKVLGLKGGMDKWEVAIKHPRNQDRAIAVLHLSNTCLVTSGDYERFFEIDGKRYHHIIDPRTGYPATGCQSASVVTFNAEYADALATACCVLGVEHGLGLIETFPGVEAILVAMDGSVHVSTGLKNAVGVPAE